MIVPHSDRSEDRVLVEKTLHLGHPFGQLPFLGRRRLDVGGSLFSDFLCGTRGERLLAPHAQRPISRCLLPTPGAVDRCLRVGRVRIDFDTMQPGVLRLFVLGAKAGDISSDVFRASISSLSVFDQRRLRALFRQPIGVRLSEIFGSHRLCNPDAPGGVLEDVEEAIIGCLSRAVEVRPQVAVAFGTPPIAQPPVEIRDALDNRGLAFALLPVDQNLHSKFSIEDVSASDVVQFARTCAQIIRDGYQRPVAGVVRAFVDHQLGFLPFEHLRSIRRRVVATGERTLNPVERVRRVAAVLLGSSSTEDLEGHPVGLIRLRRLIEVVGVVNPADDLFRGVLRFEAVREAAALLGDTCAMAKQFLMPSPPIRLSHESHLIGEGKQDGAVGVRSAAVAGFDLCSKRGHGFLMVVHTHTVDTLDYKPMIESQGWDLDNRLTVQTKNPDVDAPNEGERVGKKRRFLFFGKERATLHGETPESADGAKKTLKTDRPTAGAVGPVVVCSVIRVLALVVSTLTVFRWRFQSVSVFPRWSA